MPLTTRLAILLYFSSALGFAGSWSGVLVDSSCWTSEENNVNPDDTSTYVDRDRNLELRFCTPRTKTRSFSVVKADGTSLRLDAGGNAKAEQLVKNAGTHQRYRVTVSGDENGKTVTVNSITLAP